MLKKISDAFSNRLSVTSDRGFVLIVVIWGLGLLSVLTLAFVLNIRTHTKITANMIANTQAELFADAGINIVIPDLVENARLLPEKRRFAHNGVPYECRISDQMMLNITVTDEQGKVDLNTSGDRLLKKLFEALGVSADKASAYTDAIIDFRDTDNLKRLNGAEQAEYVAAGKKYKPKNYPFQTTGELYQVLGLSPELVEKLRPLVTIYSRRGGLDPKAATSDMKKLLFARSGEGPDQEAALYTITSNRKFFLMRVEAVGLNNARFVREAAIELKPTTARGYQLHSWLSRASKPDVEPLTQARLEALQAC